VADGRDQPDNRKQTDMTDIQKTISPVDGSVYVERELASGGSVDRVIDEAKTAQRAWRQVPLDQRATICHRFVDAFIVHKDAIAGADGDEIAGETTARYARLMSAARGAFAEGEPLIADRRFVDVPVDELLLPGQKPAPQKPAAAEETEIASTAAKTEPVAVATEPPAQPKPASKRRKKRRRRKPKSRKPRN